MDLYSAMLAKNPDVKRRDLIPVQLCCTKIPSPSFVGKTVI